MNDNYSYSTSYCTAMYYKRLSKILITILKRLLKKIIKSINYTYTTYGKMCLQQYNNNYLPIFCKNKIPSTVF